MNGYKSLSTFELVSLWEKERKRIMKTPLEKRVPADLDTLYGIRKEIDSRSGAKKPAIEFNYEQYVTQ